MRAEIVTFPVIRQATDARGQLHLPPEYRGHQLPRFHARQQARRLGSERYEIGAIAEFGRLVGENGQAVPLACFHLQLLQHPRRNRSRKTPEAEGPHAPPQLLHVARLVVQLPGCRVVSPGSHPDVACRSRCSSMSSINASTMVFTWIMHSVVSPASNVPSIERFVISKPPVHTGKYSQVASQNRVLRSKSCMIRRSLSDPIISANDMSRIFPKDSPLLSP